MRNQFAFIGERNQSAAKAVKAEIYRACGLISDFPEMGRQIEGTGLRYHSTRKYRYRVIYRVIAEGAEIMDILHPRQK